MNNNAKTKMKKILNLLLITLNKTLQVACVCLQFEAFEVFLLTYRRPFSSYHSPFRNM